MTAHRLHLPERLILFGAGVFIMSPAASISSGSSQQEARGAQVDSLMARWTNDHSPGAVVVVVRNGAVLHSKGYGLADVATGRHVGTTTLFDIASVSKQFTAMAVLMLVERGQLTYDDSLSKYFPDFRGDARRVTIRQLLQHTSGIPDYTTVWGETRKLAGNAPRTNDNVVRFLATQSLRFQPGERWEYSNSNYVLLAQIVSKASGKPFATFVRENIFAPLGMNASFVYGARNDSTDRATGYVAHGNRYEAAERNAENYVTGDGQVNTTAEDLVKWERGLAGGALVGATTLQAAFSPGRLNDGTPVSYGFGWGLGRYRGTPVLSHGGETDGFVAQITRMPARQVTVMVLSNNEQFPAPYAVANRIASIYSADAQQAPVEVRIAPERLNDYTGRYVLYDLRLDIGARDGALWLTAPQQPAIKLVPVSGDEFLIESSNGASSLGFDRNARGQIRCLTLLDQNGTMLCKH